MDLMNMHTVYAHTNVQCVFRKSKTIFTLQMGLVILAGTYISTADKNIDSDMQKLLFLMRKKDVLFCSW